MNKIKIFYLKFGFPIFFYLFLPKYLLGGEKILRAFVGTSPPIAFNPIDNSDGIISDQLNQVFDTLLWIDYNGKLVGSVANSWKQVDDFTLELKLRKDVYFHNQEHLDSEAVKFSLDLVVGSESKAKNSFYASTIEKVIIVDKYTIRIKTKKKDAFLPYRLTVIGLLVPPIYYRKVGYEGFAKVPVGSGPFIYSANESNEEKIILKSNKRYWGKVPKIDKLHFKYFANVDEALAALRRKELDFVAHLPGKYTFSIARLGSSKIVKRLVRQTILLLINSKKDGPLKNLDFRRAIRKEINILDIIKYGYHGNGKITKVLSVPGDVLFSPIRISNKNKEKSKIINKFSYKLSMLATKPFDEAGKFIFQQLRQAGFNVDLNLGTNQDEVDQVLQKNLDGKIPEVDLLVTYCSHRFGTGAFPLLILAHSKANWSLTNDHRLDELIENLESEFDVLKQKKIFREAMRYIYDQALMVPLFQTEDVFAISNKVKYKPHVLGEIFFKDIEIR